MPTRLVDHDKMKDLEALDPGELVEVLGLSTESILRAFPGHVFDYVCVEGVEEEDVEIDINEEIRRLFEDEGYSIYHVEDTEEDSSP